jgi:ABC-type Fe3+-hydroxamate transport system substrate-binding protein
MPAIPVRNPVHTRDDRGRALRWAEPPQRIVSLVPSDTYSLVRLGAKARLVGRTRYCVAPEGEVEDIAVVGGTKDADVDQIIALDPDLVVANQEENTKQDIERLEAARLRVLVSFPKRVADGIAHLARLAVVLGHAGDTSGPARDLVARAYRAVHAASARVEASPSSSPPVRAFVPIWMDPLMTVNGQTFISDVLAFAGAENVFADRERRYPLAADLGDAAPLPPERLGDRDVRYPRVTLDEVAARRPDLILLPDEPHPFTEADAAIFRSLDVPAAQRGQVVFCDGKDLMWYGARSVSGLARIAEIVEAARAAR